MADSHVAGHAGHLIDDARVRAADVDDDGRLDDIAAGERHAAARPSLLVDADHLLVEAERGAVLARRERKVVGGQHRIVDEATAGAVEPAELTARVVGERRVVDALRWPVPPGVEPGEPFADRRRRVVRTGSRCRPTAP